MDQHIIYIGLDVHKDTLAVAVADGSERGEVREHGKISNTPTAMKTLCAKLRQNCRKLRFCFEAGPCGYGIQHQLSEARHECVVVAPSLIPHAITLGKNHRPSDKPALATRQTFEE